MSAPAFCRPASDFSGEWISYDYGCYDAWGNPTSGLQESIAISTSGSEMVATKITGDACVTAGAVTFIVKSGPDVDIGKSYPARIQLGIPQNPNSSWGACTVRLDSLRKITVSGEGWSVTLFRKIATMN